jgi:hypothetical protein
MKRSFVVLLTMGMLILVCPSCYTLKSESIPLELKTIDVEFFENNAPQVVSTLSQQFTESLKDRIRTTTRLSVVNSATADATMSGAITDYHIAPVSIQATNGNAAPIAGASVLSITVNVKFVYEANKKLSFEQSFTKTTNFTGDILSQEQALILVINKQLIDDIFNKAFNNW